MENLIDKLQKEAGLTEEQALRTISVIKDYMDQEGLEIDWNKFFKGKYEDFSSRVKSTYKNVTNKIADTVEDLATKAKREARDLSDKASNIFNNEK